MRALRLPGLDGTVADLTMMGPTSVSVVELGAAQPIDFLLFACVARRRGRETRRLSVYMSGFTHFDEEGRSRMVHVGSKPSTRRMARASGRVRMAADTMAQIVNRQIAKGNVLEVARLAGIMAAKKTADLIPLCHPLTLDGVELHLAPASETELEIQAIVECQGRTGVEMEALAAVSVAALTVYDMCKSLDRGMQLTNIQLDEKSGGASGHFQRSADD